MEPECYRLEVSGRINGGYIVRAERDAPDGFAVTAASWVILPPSVQSGAGRVGGPAVERLRAAVESCGFWGLPSEGGPVGWDGTFYHLDGVRGGRTQRVVRWSGAAREMPGFEALCRLLEEFGRVATGVGW